MKPDKTSLSLILLICLSAFSWISSCTHETDTSNLPEICFKDVHTIIVTNCSMLNSGCHDGTGEAMPLIGYDDIRNAVVPYNADKSSLYKSIIAVRGEKQMPPDKPLAEELRTTIRFWIEQGAVDSTENSSACRTVTTAGGVNGNNF
jgi:hypothetical protein